MKKQVNKKMENKSEKLKAGSKPDYKSEYGAAWINPTKTGGKYLAIALDNVPLKALKDGVIRVNLWEFKDQNGLKPQEELIL